MNRVIFRLPIIGINDYMRWLEEFTQQYHCFRDDSWLYCGEEISREDWENVVMLGELFTEIENYARANYLPNKHLCSARYYSVLYNGKVYNIGKLESKEKAFYCDLHKWYGDTKEMILFEDLIGLDKAPGEKRVTRIREKLQKVDILIKELVDVGAPRYAIEERVRKALDENKAE